jgi:Ser/Thr protein kinase RdoA (MazF antagonist)
MNREEMTQICSRQVLETAAARFGTRREALHKFPEYDGAANLVYEYEIDHTPHILRVSFTPDRTLELIQAELHFVNYLGENGMNVSRPIPSKDGNWVETIWAAGIPFQIVSFEKAKGMRMPDNGYRYRAGAPLEEYYRSWGTTLGEMHALAKNYRPESDLIKRPEWFALHRSRWARAAHLPDRLQRVQAPIQSLLGELKYLPKDRDSYGLIHGDFNDGNFTVDYTNGDITVFDFDDSGYFWFAYELASAWVSGTGWTATRGPAERQSFMQLYMDHVMEGYNAQNPLPVEWLARVPLFTRLLQVEEFLDQAQHIADLDEESLGELDYKIHCIENGIPYLGFFDEIYSPEKPFSL